MLSSFLVLEVDVVPVHPRPAQQQHKDTGIDDRYVVVYRHLAILSASIFSRNSKVTYPYFLIQLVV
jgi:hypothetical protein